MKIALCFWILFFGISNAYALTLTLAGAEIITDYDEPITNADNTPLTDLAKTTIYYDKGQGQGTVKAKDVIASSLVGGAHISTPIIVPVKKGDDILLKVWVTATDNATIPNESIGSSTATMHLDFLAPSGPK